MKIGYWLRWVALCSVLVSLGFAPAVSAQDDAGPEVRWTYTPPEGAVYGSALSADGTRLVVVVGYGFSPGGAIVSLDPATGSEQWQLDIEEAPSSNPVIENGIVYAGIGSLVGGPSAAYAIDAATGAQLWRTDISNRDLPATPVDGVATGDGLLYVNRADGVLLALDLATGSVRWEAQLGKPPRGAPLAGSGTVFVSTGFDGADIFALDAATGAVRWSSQEPDNPVTGPVLADGLLYVTFTSGALISYDPATGAEQWRTAAGFPHDDGSSPSVPGLPVVQGDTVYITSNGFSGASTEAIDTATGTRNWIVPAGEFSGSAPALIGGTLIVGSDLGDLIGLASDTGTEIWRVAIPTRIHLDLGQAQPPLVVGNWIYLQDNEGGVVGLEFSGSLRSQW